MTLSNITQCSIAGIFRRTFYRRRVNNDYILIPEFQRPYCWSATDIRHLLSDVDALRYRSDQTGYQEAEGDPDPYYFGTVCFRRHQTSSSSFYLTLLDGQQRLISILLLTTILYRRAEHHPDKEINAFCRFVDTRLGEGWRDCLIVKQPQTIRRIREVAKEFELEYSIAELEARAMGSSSREADFYTETLRQDCRRMRFILEYGMVAVSVLETTREASQFFQGENNRGLSMSLLDLLKAHHMRFETVPKTIDKIQALWSIFVPPEEKESAAEKASGAERASTGNRLAEQRRALWIVEELVLPLLLLRFGVFPLYANDPCNADFLKGLLGTPRHDRLADEKIQLASGRTPKGELPPADLLQPIRPGLPFFAALDQYRRFADAVDQLEANKPRFFKNDYKLVRWMLVGWVDRFLPRKLGSASAEKIKAVLAEDPEYHAYARTFRRFLRLIKYQAYTDEQGKKRELGVFSRVDFGTVLRLMEYQSVSRSLFFLPHHSSSPTACRLELQHRLRPENLRPLFPKAWMSQRYDEAVESIKTIAIAVANVAAKTEQSDASEGESHE